MFNNKEDLELTREFKISKCGPDGLYFIGHDIMDFIARSDDMIHWTKLNAIQECVLCNIGDSFKFNDFLLEVVEKYNIPLKLYKNKYDTKIYIEYDEENSNSDILKQFNEINNQ